VATSQPPTTTCAESHRFYSTLPDKYSKLLLVPCRYRSRLYLREFKVGYIYLRVLRLRYLINLLVSKLSCFSNQRSMSRSSVFILFPSSSVVSLIRLFRNAIFASCCSRLSRYSARSVSNRNGLLLSSSGTQCRARTWGRVLFCTMRQIGLQLYKYSFVCHISRVVV
jgi:hypothetical protein